MEGLTASDGHYALTKCMEEKRVIGAIIYRLHPKAFIHKDSGGSGRKGTNILYSSKSNNPAM